MAAVPWADPAEAPAAVRLGRELRRLRLRLGLSQRGLVRALGLTAHSNLVEYELGRRIPPADILAACERLFDGQVGAQRIRELWNEALAERAGPAPPPDEPAPATLPASVADFTGRTAELRELAELISGDTSAVVITAIAGTAGVGKTALAIHFAHAIRDRFPDGQLYVNLRGYGPTPPRKPVEALAVLLDALGVPADEVDLEEERAAARYRSRLAGRRMLVVLDNAERADQVRPLLPGTPGSLVIVTSRDRLGGLIARDGARRLHLGMLRPSESVDLLARIIGAGRVAAEPDAAGELVRRCAHLPLAVRIAAANLADRPGLRLADYLADHLADSRAGKALAALAVPGDEEGAVSLAFEASYRRLPADAKRLFQRLSLLPGPDVTAGSAAALLDTAPLLATAVLDQLAAAHLVDQPSPGRYGCHDLLRHYAADRAEADDPPADRQAAADRLYDWYVSGTEQAARLLYPGVVRLAADGEVPTCSFKGDGSALEWLDSERANLVAVVAHTAQYGPQPVASRLADNLRGYFCLRLHTMDWLTVATAGLTAAADPRSAAAAHLSLTYLQLYQSRYRVAIEHGNEALRLAREGGWPQGQAAALDTLGTIYWQAGQLSRAADHYTRALTLNRITGWVPGQATNLGNLGLVYRESGRLEQAVEHFASALALDQESGANIGEAITLGNLGEAYHALGRLDTATEHLARALVLCRDLGDRGGEANVLHTLAAVDLDAGRIADAYTHARDALALAVETGDRRMEADALNVIAAIDRRRNAFEEAAEGHRRALDLARTDGSRAPEATALIGLTAVYLGLDRPDRALAYARRAQRLARMTGHRVLEGQATTALAEVYRVLGRSEEAADHARQALALHRSTGHRLGTARTLIVLGHVQRSTAPWNEARLEEAQSEEPQWEEAQSEEAPWEEALAILVDAGAPEATDVRSLLGRA